ncbi:MAG: DNA mismatch repair endonuclease MutL [Eubacteriales bacterium]|nr:DNA mismatch repair endonuclease MutL [Eubacteriales bacterium]
MTRISVLDALTANSIAAGEVVERPASVVKELVENALDAGSSVILVEIRQGGIAYLRVSDNGCGMDEEDAQLSFSRHATSKIRTIDDLEALRTMGFRGEALASIAAVAKVRLETRLLGTDIGTLIDIAAGEFQSIRPVGCPEGTSITIENLFFNTPARFKFLKKDSTEAAAVADVLERIALARPDVSFRLISQGAELLHTPGNNDLKSAIFAVFGKQAAQESLYIDYEQSPVKLTGFVGTPESARNSRSQQCFYINGRLVRSKAISAAIDEAYATHLMKRKFPLAVLLIDVPTPLVDVNVHPQKMEVRFWDEQAIFRSVYHAIKNAIQEQTTVVESDHLKTVEQPLVNPYIQSELPFNAPQVRESMQVENQLSSSNQTTEPEPSNQPAFSSLPIQSVESNLPVQSTKKTINSLRSARIIGQLLSTYLILEHEKDLLLVDQHAAHERILFEQLVGRHRARGPAAIQPLLVPQTMTVTASEQAVLMAEQDRLMAIGFEYEAFGPQTILIRSIPDGGRYQLVPQAAFRIALDSLLNDKITSEEQISDVYYSMSCKAAIKAHDLLHQDEMNRLINDLLELEDPYHCPHGRPVIIRISQYEIEKQFKRIV